MVLDNQDILFASLLGSAAVGSIQRFNTLQNELAKRVLPPIPFLPLRNPEKIEETTYHHLEYLNLDNDNLWLSDKPLSEPQQYFPLSFSFGEPPKYAKWLFPYEPMITFSSGNVIAESNVSKQGSAFRGTIKERWTEKDWDITITGVLFGSLLKGKPEDCFPTKKLTELMEFLIAAKTINIYNHALNDAGILKVAIYDYSFPFTKGENVQAYEIKCKSDDPFDLLIKDTH
jgi:hypothetical protein